MKSPASYIKRLKELSKKRFAYEPLITVEISRSRLLHNLAQFRKIAPGGMIAPVLKSNAYGHGLFEIADIFEKGAVEGISFFVVDSYFEALALRTTHGIRKPILVVGYTRPETMAASPLKNVSFAITNIDTLQSLSRLIQTGSSGAKIKSSAKISVHIKIDTGMRRQGLLPSEIPDAIAILRKNRHISVDGIFTHFSDADNGDQTFTKKQIELWNSTAAQLKAEFPEIKYIHASATDGHRFSRDIQANVSRLGLGLYGLSDDLDFARKMDLQPVLSMKTIVTGVKKLKAGETVGYGNTFKAWKDTTIATIPVGYYEGLNRKLSNNGTVTVAAGQNGKDSIVCPIIGRVSMNITTIEIPSDKNIGAGTPVIAISNDAYAQNSIVSMAKKTGSITYEIAAHIPAHLKRVVV